MSNNTPAEVGGAKKHATISTHWHRPSVRIILVGLHLFAIFSFRSFKVLIFGFSILTPFWNLVHLVIKQGKGGFVIRTFLPQ